jgi:hypothetical protein
MKTLFLSTVLGLACAGTAQADSLINPGFELPFGNPSGPADGWYHVSESIFWDCGEAASGSCSAMLASDPLDRSRDVLWQDVATSAGAEYRLSFVYKTNRNTDRGAPAPFSQGRFAIDPASGTSGHNYPVAHTFTGNADWQRYDFLFTAAGASSRIAFGGLGFSNGRAGNFINIDEVSIARAVPEPAMAALMLGGLGALGLAGRGRLIGRRAGKGKTA